MNTYIALFRGINVGGKNILRMKDITVILEGLGYENIRTYIQSGNVIFQSDKTVGDDCVGEIAKRVLEDKGFEPRVLLLSVAELESAVANNSFDTEDGKLLHFFFLESKPKQAGMALLESIKAESEAFELCDKVFYLYAPDGVGRSKLMARVEKALGVAATARNWNTVRKLVSMAGE